MTIINTHNRNSNSKARFGGTITPSVNACFTCHKQSGFVVEKTTFSIKDCVVYRNPIFSRRHKMKKKKSAEH